MSTHYWRNRWINALVHNGIDPDTAAHAFAETYRDQSADQSKSPETQALLALAMIAGGKQGARNLTSATKS